MLWYTSVYVPPYVLALSVRLTNERQKEMRQSFFYIFFKDAYNPYGRAV